MLQFDHLEDLAAVLSALAPLPMLVQQDKPPYT